MKRFEKIGIIKNVGSGWLGLVVNVATGIVISPYILHKLGDEAFGLWVLVFAITGYYGLFDLGIRSSVVRYVAKFTATGNHDELNRLFNTSLFSFGCVGLFLLLVTGIGSIYMGNVFHVQPAYLNTARILFLMVGSSVSLNFPLGVFGGILEGLQKFYLINLINVTSTLLRAALILVALHHGYGLLTVALITVLLPVMANLVNMANVFRLEHLRIGLSLVSKATFKEIFSYGSTTFMISLADKLRFKTDAMVIGTFLSAAAITPFAIGSRLVDYGTSLVDSLAQIFTPMSSHFHAKGEIDRLRSIFIAGNRACALIVFPICAGLILLGKSVIQIWMGAKYVPASYPILLILLIPTTLRMAQATSSRILFGMARHRILAVVIFAEGIANLVLSVLLVRPYGIIGDAMGTAIPLTITCLFFLPQHLCGILGLRLRTYLVKAYGAPFLLCLPMAACLILLQRWFVPHKLLGLAVQAGLAGALYAGLVYYFMFLKGPLSLRTEETDPPEDNQVLHKQAAVIGSREA
jgi:O-antigen/teichoic acid export membrane protein